METIILYIAFSYIFMAGAMISVKKANKDVSVLLLVFLWVISPLSMPFHLGV